MTVKKLLLKLILFWVLDIEIKTFLVPECKYSKRKAVNYEMFGSKWL